MSVVLCMSVPIMNGLAGFSPGFYNSVVHCDQRGMFISIHTQVILSKGRGIKSIGCTKCLFCL